MARGSVSRFLVVSLWCVAQVIDWFPKGDSRIAARSVHITLGVILAVLLPARVLWRAGPGLRLPAYPGLIGRAARIVHHTLYVLVAGAVVLGVANVWVRGDSFFGWFSVPKLAPGNQPLKTTVEEWHGWLANTVLVVAGVHALAALVHHLAFRDGVLRRMLPGRD